MHAAEVMPIPVQELQIRQVIDDAFVAFHLDRSFRRGLRRGRALQLSSRGCTLKSSEEHICGLRVQGVVTLEEEREMVALRLIDCNKPYCRTYTRVVKWILPFDN